MLNSYFLIVEKLKKLKIRIKNWVNTFIKNKKIFSLRTENWLKNKIRFQLRIENWLKTRKLKNTNFDANSSIKLSFLKINIKNLLENNVLSPLRIIRKKFYNLVSLLRLVNQINLTINEECIEIEIENRNILLNHKNAIIIDANFLCLNPDNLSSHQILSLYRLDPVGLTGLKAMNNEFNVGEERGELNINDRKIDDGKIDDIEKKVKAEINK